MPLNKLCRTAALAVRVPGPTSSAASRMIKSLTARPHLRIPRFAHALLLVAASVGNMSCDAPTPRSTKPSSRSVDEAKKPTRLPPERPTDEVDLHGSAVTRGALKAISGRLDVRLLVLSEASVEAADLEPLAQMQALEELWLVNTQVGDGAGQHLGKMAGLRELKLNFTTISDEDLKQWGGLQNLEELDLSYTLVTGAGLRHLKPLVRLKSLTLPAIGMTADGVKHLESLPALEVIVWPYGQFTKHEVAALARLPSLRELDIREDATIDAIEELRTMRKLERLAITVASREAMAALPEFKSLKRLALGVSEPNWLRELRIPPSLEELNLKTGEGFNLHFPENRSHGDWGVLN